MPDAEAYQVIESERLPAVTEPYKFYYSPRFQMAALSCPCGCGHRVMLNLLDQHSCEFVNGLPTVYPSILAADAPCRSHFWIRKGEVVWAEKWSKARVQRVMAAQLQRHLGKKQAPLTRWAKFMAWLKSLFRR